MLKNIKENNNKPLLYSIKTAAAVSGIPKNTIKRWVKEGRFEIIDPNNGQKGLRIVVASFELWLDKRNKMPKFGGRNPKRAHGERRKNKGGYVTIYIPDHPSCNMNGSVLEHRIVMEEHIGRKLERWEMVHHKNGIKDDNRVENLEVVLSGTHFGDVKCPHCLKTFKIK